MVKNRIFPHRNILIAMGILGFALFLVYLIMPGKNVFELPIGYRGVFCIVRDTRIGVEVESRFRTSKFVIPESGILYVKSLEPFRRWFKEDACYSDGTKIPVITGSGFQSITPKTIHLRLQSSGDKIIPGTDSNDIVMYLIGNCEDEHKIREVMGERSARERGIFKTLRALEEERAEFVQ